MVLSRQGTEIEGAQTIESEIEEFRTQHGRWVAKFKAIDSISEAEAWVGSQVAIRQDEWPEAEPGSFFSFDLEGCEVMDAGRSIGRVTGILDYGGTVLLELDRDGDEILIPFARSFLKDIDTDAKRIEVELPEGLVELNSK